MVEDQNERMRSIISLSLFLRERDDEEMKNQNNTREV